MDRALIAQKETTTNKYSDKVNANKCLVVILSLSLLFILIKKLLNWVNNNKNNTIVKLVCFKNC